MITKAVLMEEDKVQALKPESLKKKKIFVRKKWIWAMMIATMERKRTLAMKKQMSTTKRMTMMQVHLTASSWLEHGR